MALTLSGSQYAFAQQDAVEEGKALPPVEVVGTRLKRTDVETASPVLVITREEIARSGAASAFELLSNLTVTNGGPFNEMRSVANGNTASNASLRGLGPTATLVLLDGRRVAGFAFGVSTVDLNSIPIAAIERVEILKDGASAVYGSDAIAGVINFILRKDYQGIEATASYAHPQQGGAAEKRVTLTGGVGNLLEDRYNLIYSLDHYRHEGMLLGDRDFSRSGVFPQIGFDARSTLGNPGSYAFATTPNTFNPAPGCPAERIVGGFCAMDVTSGIAAIMPSTKTTALARGVFALTPGHRFVAEALVGKNDYENIIAPTSITAPAASGYRMPAASPYNPFGQDILVRWRTTQLGPRIAEIETESSRLLLGLEGQLNRWDYKTGIGSARSKARSINKSGYISDTAIRAGLANGTINGLGDTSAIDLPVLQATQVTGLVRSSTSRMDFADFSASRDLWNLPAGPVRLALGVERRRESIDDQPTPVLQSGDVIASAASQPINGSRNAWSAFTEAAAPLGKTTDITLALRHDHYSDFGGTTNPKVGMRWQPVRQLLLRGSYGTGFRAPGLDQLHRPASSGFATTRASDPLRCGRPGAVAADCNNQMRTQFGGNSDLQPEESRQLTLGLLWEPTENMSAEVSWWKINKKQDISSLTTNVILANIDRFGSLVIREPATAADTAAGLPGIINFIDTREQNLGKTRVQGLDLDLAYRFPMTGIGRFSLRSASTYLMKYRSQLDGVTFTQMEGRFVNNTPLPKWRHNLALLWQRDVWAGSLIYHYISSYEDSGTNRLTGEQLRVGRWQSVDVQGSYSGFKDTVLTAGIKNLFNRSPPFSIGSTFAPGWDNLTHDPRGRIFYATLNYRFK